MTTEVSAGPFGWLQNSAVTRQILGRGVAVFAMALGLSVLLSVLALLAIAAGAAQALPMFPGGGFAPSSGQGTDPGTVVGVFLMIVSFVFFTAHLVPFNADLSFFGSSVSGVGSLLITGAIVAAAYRAGGRLERMFPNSSNNGESALRAACIAVPYWVGSLLLFLVSSIHSQSTSPYGASAYETAASIGPSALGLLTPLLLVGGAAGIGARRRRGGSASATSRYAARGFVLALFSIALGTLATLAGAIIAALIGLVAHASGPATPSNGPTPTVSPTAGGPVFAVLAILVAIFYIPNGLVWLWGSALGLNLSTVGWLILAFGAVGALLGALTIQSRIDRTEQVSFAVTFGVVSCLLAFISRPTIGAYALGANPLVVLIVGLAIGTVLAVAGPYAAQTGLGQSALSLPPMRWALRRLHLRDESTVDIERMMPSLSFSTPGTDTRSMPGHRMPATDWDCSSSSRATAVVDAPVAPPHVEGPQPALPPRARASRASHVRFGKKARIGTAMIVVAAVGITGASIYLGSITTAQAAARAYEEAVGNNDASAIWSRLAVTEPASNGIVAAQQGAARLLGENDLKAMLVLPQNARQSRSNISIGSMTQNGDTAILQVSYQQQGQTASDTLTLVRRSAERQFLFYPVWKVAMTPGSLSVNLPAKGARIAVDGTHLPPDTATAYVLPGAHKVTLLASGPFAATDQVTTVQSQVPAQVSLTSMSLTPEARTDAAAAVKSYFTNCLQSTNSFGSDCPQHINDYVIAPITWQLVGDPTSNMVATVDSGCPTVTASGHYLMTASYTAEGGAAHRISGGTYAIPLTWNGQSFQHENQRLGYCGSMSHMPPLANPGASSASVLAAVQAGWQACLKATVLNPPDCPASAYGYQQTSVKWSSTTDPTAGAQITWDGDTGLYLVTGNYSVVASYDSFGSTQRDPISGPYTAYVTWDGQSATLQYIGQR